MTISEIIPGKDDYTISDIIRYEDGRYVKVNSFSEGVLMDMKKHMSKGEGKRLFEQYCV